MSGIHEPVEVQTPEMSKRFDNHAEASTWGDDCIANLSDDETDGTGQIESLGNQTVAQKLLKQRYILSTKYIE